MDETPVEIRSVSEVGPGTVALGLDTPSGFEAQPGQFLQIRATVDGDPVTRHYSISSPFVGETVEVTVGVDPDGTLSPWLATRSSGDTVEIDGPYGRVFYEDEEAVGVCCAGPGIGPGLAIAERTVAEGGSATLVYRSATPVHESRLAALAVAGGTVALASDDEAVDRAVAAAVSDDPDRQWFVYGFADLLETARSAMERAGLDPDEAKVENFG